MGDLGSYPGIVCDNGTGFVKVSAYNMKVVVSETGMIENIA